MIVLLYVDLFEYTVQYKLFSFILCVHVCSLSQTYLLYRGVKAKGCYVLLNKEDRALLHSLLCIYFV